MKQKKGLARFISFILAIICFLVPCLNAVGEGDPAAIGYSDADYAISHGLIDQWDTEAPDRNITAREMISMADDMIRRLYPEGHDRFLEVYPEAAVSDTLITRYDAMAIVLAAAEYLGVKRMNNDFWDVLQAQMGDGVWGEMHWNTDLFGDTGSLPSIEFDRHACAYFFSFGRICFANNQPLFDYDEVSNSMRINDLITWEEAETALIRLAASIRMEIDVDDENRRGLMSDKPEDNARALALLGDSRIVSKDSEEGQKEIARLNERIGEIKGTAVAIVQGDEYVPGVSYSGTAYYVDSEKGKNNRDGKSPKTAVADYEAIRQNLQYGDAVFFKRGQVHSYPVMAVTLVDGVTYSAYGEGAKPILTCSPLDLNSPKNWELYYEGNGCKIWHSRFRDFGSVGWMDFNCSDELYAYPVYEYWSEENGYQFVETVHRDFSYPQMDHVVYTLDEYGEKKTLPIEEMLTQNLTFISRVDYADQMKKDILLCDYRGTDLYLRCDEGNPAKVFKMIKITDGSRVGPLQGAGSDHVTLDNLNICNGSQWGVGHMTHATIQNCEVCWIGNHIERLGNWLPGTHETVFHYIGDAIYCCSDGSVFDNNYIHHVCCNGIVVENEDHALEPLVVSSNVITKTGVGYSWSNDSRWRLSSQEATVRDNIFAYQGQAEGFLRWYNEFQGILIRTFADNEWVQGTAKISSQHHIINNTIIEGYEDSISNSVTGMSCFAEFTGNTFVGKPENHLLLLTDSALVVDYASAFQQNTLTAP